MAGAAGRRSLSSRFVHNFTKKDWRRGADYVVDIVIEKATSSRIDANVQGTARAPYRVYLDFDRTRKTTLGQMFCSCPRFADTIANARCLPGRNRPADWRFGFGPAGGDHASLLRRRGSMCLLKYPHAPVVVLLE